MNFWWLRRFLRDKVRPFTRWENYRNLIRWIPVVWDTHWWDYGYLLRIMRHQLKLMDENWKHSCYLGSEEEQKTIREARFLLDRIAEDDYEAPEHLKVPATPLFERFCNEETMNPTFYGDERRATDLKHFCVLLERNLFKWWD